MKTYQAFVIALISFAALAASCTDFSFNFSTDKGSKLYFCESYNPESDECLGKAKRYTQGALTVMVDLRKDKKTLEVNSININITNLKTGEVEDTFAFDTNPSSDYVYFNNVKFLRSGKFRVSALKPDGTVIVSNEIEIIDE